jgi:hypothetical protein
LDERNDLRALVIQAMDLRDGPYIQDAVEAIVDWHARRALTLLERRQEQDARIRRLALLVREAA